MLAGRRGQYCYGGPKVLPYLGLKLVVMTPTPNRDLPEVVSELIIEMHEVRSELNAINGRIDRLDQRVESLERTVSEGFRALREEIRENSRNTIAGITRAFEPFLNRLLDHDDRLKSQETRLGSLENPQK